MTYYNPPAAGVASDAVEIDAVEMACNDADLALDRCRNALDTNRLDDYRILHLAEVLSAEIRAAAILITDAINRHP